MPAAGVTKLEQRRFGLVLAGGGTRGAYEVGVLQGITEILSAEKPARSPFQLIAGSSVGAINAAFMAANAHRQDFGLHKLVDAWAGLDISRHLRFRIGPFLAQMVKRPRPPDADSPYLGTSLLEPDALEELVAQTIDWPGIRQNVQSGHLGGLFIAALEVATGTTAIFNQLSSDVTYVGSRDPRRRGVVADIGAAHVLASAAIPLVFPARRLNSHYYCDGGLRFNTPISPVIRSGATDIVIITSRRADTGNGSDEARSIEYFPTPTFLLGKVLNALLLDPLAYDLQVLQRINRLIEVHARTLTAEESEEVNRLLEETRGMHYRPLNTLVFSPSADIAKIASDHIAAQPERFQQSPILTRLFRSAIRLGGQADWLTYLLFDGGYADKLMALGRKDALARTADVRAFFGQRNRP